jgi:hypothetical protein
VISRNQHLALWSFYDLHLTYILIGRNQHLALWRLSDLSRFYKENYEAGRIKPFNRSTISHYEAHFCAVDTDVSKVNFGKTNRKCFGTHALHVLFSNAGIVKKGFIRCCRLLTLTMNLD